jgi:long-subunit acyl-CoA synthetase (AMP-forming)
MIEGMAKIGFDITHVYGLTEVYGPASVAVKRDAWAQASSSEQTRLNGRQGVRYPLQEGDDGANPKTMLECPADGNTMGEIMFRGNIVMKGYLKNPKATQEAFEGGWFAYGRFSCDGTRPLREDQGSKAKTSLFLVERTSVRLRWKTLCIGTLPCWLVL